MKVLIITVFLLISLSSARRYYDADLGVWISPDAARQHHSLYTYASNNPTNRIDPDGNADVYARPLDVPGGRLLYENIKAARHDYWVFDNPQMINGKKVKTWGMYGDNGAANSQAVFRPDQFSISFGEDLGLAWVPDRFVVSAIQALESEFQTYDVRCTHTNCQGFSKSTHRLANSLWQQEMKVMEEKNPLFVNLLDE